MSLLRLLLICFVLWDIYAISSDLMYHFFLHIIGWRLSVSINDVMLCYVKCLELRSFLCFVLSAKGSQVINACGCAVRAEANLSY